MGRGTWLNWRKQHPELQTKGFNYKYSKNTKTLLHHIWDPVQGEKRRRRQIDDRTDVVWIRKCISLKLRQFSLKLLHRSTIEFWATIYWTPPPPLNSEHKPTRLPTQGPQPLLWYTLYNTVGKPDYSSPHSKHSRHLNESQEQWSIIIKVLIL